MCAPGAERLAGGRPRAGWEPPAAVFVSQPDVVGAGAERQVDSGCDNGVRTRGTHLPNEANFSPGPKRVRSDVKSHFRLCTTSSWWEGGRRRKSPERALLRLLCCEVAHPRHSGRSGWVCRQVIAGFCVLCKAGCGVCVCACVSL